jgi:adenosylcobinamide kinase/adenosylcobinamide-phosphate guanylyltransferase
VPHAHIALPSVTLVLGGAGSGKSRYAEGLVECAIAAGGEGLYLATATAGDAEMTARIARHRARRGTGWATVEEPVALATALTAEAGPGRVVLVDCLTLWLTNIVACGRDPEVAAADLTEALGGLGGPVLLVSNEVGMGIVPEGALARAFRDQAGQLNQAMAARAERVVFVAAGLPLILKDQP